MSNAIPPSVTPPSPNEWINTLRMITNITRGSNTLVTAPSHTFTSLDENITTVIFLQVKGMRQINGLPGRILTVVDANNFIVDIDSTNFYPYSREGVISIVTGHPPIQQASFQTFNTPFQNVA